jgi:hypothetical protein
LPGGSSPRDLSIITLPREKAMKELVRTNDTVRLSWLQAILAWAGIEAVILDNYTSVVEGSIGAIPRRLMVRDEDESRARTMLKEAGDPA